MKKGIDFTGITVSFFCHDGQGNYVMNKRGVNCRDEQGCWDFGGGGLKFNETLEDCVVREIEEEYGVKPLSITYLGFDEKFRTHNDAPTHWIGFRYIAEVDRGKVMNNEPDKHDEIAWFRIDSLPTPLHSLVKPDVIKYRKYV